MGSQQPFNRINKSFENLKQQIVAASPTLSRSELLDLADEIHDAIRKRHDESLFVTAPPFKDVSQW